MSFVSLPFFLFVAALTLVYFLVPKQFRWIVLLVGSYAFYWSNSAWLVLVLFAGTLVTFLIGQWIQSVSDKNQAYLKENRAGLSREERKRLKERGKKAARRIMWLGIAFDLGALLFLKYFNFFAYNVNAVLAWASRGQAVPTLNLLLPLGISFYTLQAISYMADVYRGKTRADGNLAKFMLYMSFFPQIVQGPIPRHDRLAHQLYEGHDFDYTRLCHGAQLALWGLFKKLVISERLAVAVNHLFGSYSSYSGPILLFAGILYGLQVYADFSGGMDIGRGVARMLGIELELNFEQPYFSTSVEDFWRRWHITMGNWMKDYIFYPLSMSKAFTALGRQCRKRLGQYVGNRIPPFIAMFIVYVTVGFWHGPSWNFIAYGIWNGLFIMTGILLDGFYARLRRLLGMQDQSACWRLFSMARTFVIISFGRIFSRSDSLTAALDMFRRMFMNWRNITFLTNGDLLKTGLNTANWFALCAFLLLLLWVDVQHERKVSLCQAIDRQPLLFRWGIYIGAVVLVLIFGFYGPAYNAADFIYQQF